MENYEKPTLEMATDSSENQDSKGVVVAFGAAALYLAAATIYATVLIAYDTMLVNKNIN